MVNDIYKEGLDGSLIKDTTGVTRYDMASQDLNSFNGIDLKSKRTYKRGTLTITSGTYDPILGQSTATGTVTHNLGYVPVFDGAYRVGSTGGFSPVPDFTFYFSAMGYGGFWSINSRANAYTITFDVFADITTITYPITIKYYIYREKLNVQ